MANFTKQHIKETFLKLLEDKPLSEISVKLIVENCGINRKSFYYHYQDIPALLNEVITENTDLLIEKSRAFDSVEDCLHTITDNLLNNKKTVLHIYRSVSRDVYEKGLLKMCDYIIRMYTDKVLDGRNIDKRDKEVVIALYTSECFGILIRWLLMGMDEDIGCYIDRICELRDGTFKEIIERCKDVK